MSEIFISYRRKDKARLQPLLEALEQHGVSYWLDTNDIDHLEDFSLAIGGALSQAKILLAWYSFDYPQSRACQWEFTAAFLTAQKQTGPLQRLVVINPEETFDHLLLPQEVSRQNMLPAPDEGDSAACAKLAQQLKEHLAKINAPFGQLSAGVNSPCYGRKLTHSPQFVGRLKEFWQIHWALHNGSDKTITAAAPVNLVQLTGLGGMGKSMFTEEYACRYGWAYPGGVFWLSAYGGDGDAPEQVEGFGALLHQQLDKIARELGINPALLDDPQQLPMLIRNRLEQNGLPYLWIVDDLPGGLKPSELENWLAPDTVHGKTLITTRATGYKRGPKVPFDKLDDASAYDLLTRGQELEGQGEIAAAKGIVADLGGHPLALELAAATMEGYVGMVSYAEYRQQLADPDEDALRLAEEFIESLPNGHEKSIAATMQHSLKQLGEEGLDFLRLASQLASAPIPAPLVAKTFELVDELEEAKAVQRAALAFKQTEQHSLSHLVDKSNGLRFVHAMLCRVVRFDATHKERRHALREAAVKALYDLLENVEDNRTHPQLEPLIPHARMLSELLETEAEMSLAGQLAWYDYSRGDFAVAKALQEQVLEQRKKILGADHTHTLISMNNLAGALQAMGDYAGGKALHEQVLERRKEILGADHPGTLTSMNNLAETLRAMDEHTEARALHEQALEQRKEILGADHPDTLSSMNNLASTLRAMGDHVGAKTLQKQVLEQRKEILGADHPGTLSSMNNLALTLRAMGDHAGAKALHEQVLEKCCALLGARHPTTTGSSWNLYTILDDMGEGDAAQAVIDEHLLWLLDENVELTSGQQRDIRDMLRQVVGK
ncbi:MAG: tetratricopeptide repeat protein [Desulfuromonadales bacterium]|nr:tetratricopeptide repeat protein [Desulfuromonadales bacterium]